MRCVLECARVLGFRGALLALLVGVLLLAPTRTWAAGRLHIDFIDVGQGDAALVTSPSGKTVLIDGGPRMAVSGLVRFLRTRTRGPLDLILLSHRHEDHLGGLAAVVREVGARLFLDAPMAHPGPGYAALMRALESQGVAVRDAAPGRTIDLGGGAVMTLIGPPVPPIVGSRSDVNSNSVIARLTYGTVSVLFTGDAEVPTEAWLIRSRIDLHASVLKVAHHGSRYASSALFLRAVAPRIAVVSVGANNAYGHPAQGALERLASTGATIYRTDMDGTIAIETDGVALEVQTAQHQEVPGQR